MGAHCIITGVPGSARLGEIEGMLLPEIQQRIIMIEVQGTTALIEFESERDADACVGECQLREATVQVERHEGGVLTPSRAPKRVKPESKADKEKRLNRVGLSYRFAPARPAVLCAPPAVLTCGILFTPARCGRCGLPKKGHVCTPPESAGVGPGVLKKQDLDPKS